jgi:serine/threonine-protein kinase
MRRCPRCKLQYPDEQASCPKDGAALIDEEAYRGKSMSSTEFAPSLVQARDTAARLSMANKAGMAAGGLASVAPVGAKSGAISVPPAAAKGGAISVPPAAAKGGAISVPPVMTVEPDAPAPAVVLGAPAPVTFPDLQAGMQVGEYVIDGRLGEGGMAVVYAGSQPVIGKRVAIKVLAPSLASDADMVRRFVQEARAVNQIGHRNIIDIFSFSQLPDGRHYFVMELLAGRSLTDRINDRRHPLQWRETVDIWLQVCGALAAAHSRGIVHRDLKPDNLFLVASPDGDYIKVLDFGIAKLMGDGQEVRKTATGVPMGTPVYMSPEQTAGRNVAHHTDIYAMGVLMFEMIAGYPPFDSDNYVAILYAHMNQAPPKLSEKIRIHPDLESLILRMLAKKPEDRPQTMDEVRAEIVRLQKEADAGGRPLFAYPGGDVIDGRGGKDPSRKLETERVEPRPMPPERAPKNLRTYAVVIPIAAALIGGLIVWGVRSSRTPATTPVASAPVTPAATEKPAPAPTAPAVEAPRPAAVAPAMPQQQYGKIRLTIDPPNVKDTRLFLNQRIVKEPALSKVEVGFVMVRVEAPGYVADEEGFDLKPDMEYPVTLHLKKSGGHSGGKAEPKGRGATDKAATPAATPPEELHKDGTMDPFKK